jgi:hypothetical protein
LNVEELLFAATLTTDLNEQLRIYKETERVHPTDYRAANNVGYIYMLQNKLDEAAAQFTKANTITGQPHQHQQPRCGGTPEGRPQESDRTLHQGHGRWS